MSPQVGTGPSVGSVQGGWVPGGTSTQRTPREGPLGGAEAGWGTLRGEQGSTATSGSSRLRLPWRPPVAKPAWSPPAGRRPRQKAICLQRPLSLHPRPQAGTGRGGRGVQHAGEGGARPLVSLGPQPAPRRQPRRAVCDVSALSAAPQRLHLRNGLKNTVLPQRAGTRLRRAGNTLSAQQAERKCLVSPASPRPGPVLSLGGTWAPAWDSRPLAGRAGQTGEQGLLAWAGGSCDTGMSTGHQPPGR